MLLLTYIFRICHRVKDIWMGHLHLQWHMMFCKAHLGTLRGLTSFYR